MNALNIPDGELQLIPHFIPAGEAEDFLRRLSADLNWQEEKLAIFGREVAVPRRVAWHGDPGAVYRYSGIDHCPEPWTPDLADLRERIERRTGRRFNSVLCNLYRDGNDAMGWHADKEKELGPEPYIASLSLGAERRFDLRHNRTGQTLSLSLPHGGLLLMGGSLQRHWRHRLPRRPGLAEPRINLTYRLILIP